MKFLRSVLPHITIILSLTVTVILVIDMFINSAMGFSSSPIYKWFCLLLCITSLVTSIFLIMRNRRAVRKKNKRK